MKYFTRLLCILSSLFLAPVLLGSGPPIATMQEYSPMLAAELDPAPSFQLTKKQSQFLPGTPIVVAVEREDLDYARARLWLPERRPGVWRPAFRQGGAASNGPRWYAFVPLGPGLDPGIYTLELEAQSRDGLYFRQEIPIEILERRYQTQSIPLTRQLTEVRTGNPETRVAESENLTLVIAEFNPEAWYATYLFKHPLRGTQLRPTSEFAARRVFVDDDGTRSTSVHAGRDYGAPTGTALLSPAPGRVVFAGHRQVTGNTLVIEHGPGIYTLYYHMHSIALELDALVGGETLLGTVGETGLATGPHLHWELRMALEILDPEFYLDRPFLDTDFELW